MATRVLTITFLITLTHMLATCGPQAWCEEELPAPVGISVANDHRGTQTDTPRPVQVEVQLVELPVGKMRELGFDWATISGEPPIRTRKSDFASLLWAQQYEPQQIIGLLDALRQNDLARILAAPKVITLDGRSATLETSAEITIEGRAGKPSKTTMAGMRVDILPKMIEADRCRVELRLEWSGISRDSNNKARLRKHQLDTAFATESGKTFIVSTTMDSDRADQTCVLVLVTPTLLAAPAAKLQTAEQPTELR